MSRSSPGLRIQRERLREAVRSIPSRLLDVPAPTTIGLGDTFLGGFLAALVR
jgi:ADP-dependent phosphofructokinase/glucokinase